MLTEIYIEAFDEELADQVWEAWDAEEIDDFGAYCAWCLVAYTALNLWLAEFAFVQIGLKLLHPCRKMSGILDRCRTRQYLGRPVTIDRILPACQWHKRWHHHRIQRRHRRQRYR